MRLAVLLPFLAAIQCLELAVIFCIVYLKVSRRPENLVFSVLAFFLGSMIGCELLLQETDSLQHGLFWYRLQLFCALFASVLIIHFIFLIVGQPLSRRIWIGLLYPLTTLLAVGAWHPLVLHLPPPHTRLVDIDREAPGLLFYPYTAPPLIGLIIASYLGLRGLKIRRKQAAGEADFRPLFRHGEWIVAGLLLIILAAAIEIIQLVLIPKTGTDLPINPRAVAVTLFCVITACVLGREVFRNELHKRHLDTENRARLQAIRDVQHEVQNKLVGITTPLLVAHMQMKRGDGFIDPATSVAVALGEAEKLASRVNWMLNAARMEAGRPPVLESKQPTDIQVIVQSLCDRWMHLQAQEREVLVLDGGTEADLPRCHLHLTASLTHPRAPVHADALVCILDNLLGNAVKYSPHGGDIRVHLEQQSGLLTIIVSDSGIGIAPEDQKRIFEEPFHRGRAARAITGTGLGLNLVKRLLEAQGGQIAVRSAPDQGSTFTLTLPWLSDDVGACPVRSVIGSP